MTRHRLPGWPERLAEALEARREVPFQWGDQDCVLFAAGVVEAITGRDPALGLRGVYGTEDEAAALLDARGGLEQAAAEAMTAFGAEEIPSAFAQRGDVVLLEIGNDLLLGVVAGDTAMAPGPDGLRAVPLRRCAKRAWAV